MGPVANDRACCTLNMQSISAHIQAAKWLCSVPHWPLQTNKTYTYNRKAKKSLFRREKMFDVIASILVYHQDDQVSNLRNIKIAFSKTFQRQKFEKHSRMKVSIKSKQSEFRYNFPPSAITKIKCRNNITVCH